MTKALRSTAALNDADRSQIVEVAWADDVSFDAIRAELGVSEAQVIAIMRATLKRNSFKLWRARVSGRVAKHDARQKARRTLFL
jgi:uncharacterized protein (TIGR03643 family)